jgi:flagellar basal-body rod protein FlgF
MPGGLLEIGEMLLATSQRRLDTVSQNVANASTPGFKSDALFESALQATTIEGAGGRLSLDTDFSQGALRGTGRSLDLAIAGPGFFELRAGDQVYYTRAGAFERDSAGRLVDIQGFALQSSDGGDIVLASSQVEILSDGVILEGGAPVARVGVFDATAPETLTRVGGNYFAAREGVAPVAEINLRQGMLEAANVDMAAQMLDMMTAIRSAEVGARVVQAYDTLIGQTISTFGRR